MPQKRVSSRRLVALIGAITVSLAAPAAFAATITGWNTDNVAVDTSDTPGVTGKSVVYDQPLGPGESVPPGATSSGAIAFTPTEAVSPGLKVQPETYSDTGSGATLELDGCLMTSNPGATCTSEFQSGKRIKQVITGFEPVDLVFDVDATDTTKSAYQVFSRLINDSGASLTGAKVELGFGIGEDFVAASSDDLRFSSEFTAQPNDSGKSSTSQFPFGLFGDADDSPNFLLDGFFAADRSGFDLDQTETSISTAGYYGAYPDIFGEWKSLESASEGLFWDFDADEDTDNLLMAWEIGADLWELRRTVGETCDPTDATNCTFGVTLDDYLTGTYDEIVEILMAEAGDVYFSIFGDGPIEDLANLNLNYAIELGDLTGRSSFTLRTSVLPISPVPLPAGMPLLLGGLGLFAALRRRKVTLQVN